MKKFRFLLALLMAMTGITSAQAQEAYAVVTKNSDNQPVEVTFYYDTNKASFPESNVWSELNDQHASSHWTGTTLTSATIDLSFKNYTGLTSLYQWFSNCSNLTSITGLENLNTANVTTMYGMFHQCKLLTELDLSNFNTAKVTDMSFMFNNCQNLETIYVGDGWTTASVGASDLMFTADSKLIGGYGTIYNVNHQTKDYAVIDGPDAPGYLSKKGERQAYAVVTKNSDNKPVAVAFYFDTFKSTRTGDNVTIVNMLKANNVYQNWADQTLTSATFDPSFSDYEGLTSLKSWFNNCSSLPTINGLTNLNTENVTTMEYMFYYCSALTELDLSSFNVSKVTTFDYMFNSCSNLETIYATGNWNTGSNPSSSSMFTYCAKLLGGALTPFHSNYTNLEYARVDGGPDNPGYFTDKTVPIPYAVVAKNSEGSPLSVTFYYDNDKNTRVGNNITIVRALNKRDARNYASEAWSGTSQSPSTLSTVTFDSSFSGFEGLTSLYRWFYYCPNLTTVNNLSALKTLNVTSMESMFQGCSSLTELDLTGFNTSNTTTMASMFQGCSSLSELNLSSFVVSKVENTSSMFSGCTNLENIYATADWSASAINSSSSNMFYDCVKLCGSAGTGVKTYYDKTYARLDNPLIAPGYFSQQGVARPYAVVTKNAEGNPQTVTFYYDTNMASHEGDGVTIVRRLNTSDAYEGWAGSYQSTSPLTTATFAPSFANFDALTSLYQWFFKCPNLTTINGIENLNTTNVTTMYSLFQSCSSLTELDLSTFNTAKVSDMGYMFAYCSNLQTIYVGDGWNTEAVPLTSDLFNQSSKLIGGYGTSYNSNHTDKSYARIDGPGTPGYMSKKGEAVAYAVVTKNSENKPVAVAFYYDKLIDTRTGTIVRGLNGASVYRNWAGSDNGPTLTSVTFDESFGQYHGLTSLFSWFNNCSSLTAINGLEFLNTENVTTMDRMFYYCRALTKLDLSTFNTANVTNMQYMFYYCTALTDLDLTGFEVSKVTDFREMFSGCSKLETIYATGDWNAAAPDANAINMFNNCNKLLGGAMTAYNSAYTGRSYARVDGGNEAPGYFCKKGEPLAYAVVTKNDQDRATSVAFYYNTLKDTHVGENVVIVRNLNEYVNYGSYYAYKNWAGTNNGPTLTSVTFDTSFAGFTGLTSMYHWFDGCSNLTTITGLEHLNTSNVTKMESLFSECSSLTSLDLSTFDTQNVLSMNRMFLNCSALASLDLTGSFSTANVTDMQYMFYGCSALTELDLGNFDVSKVANTTYMFYGCINLDAIYATVDWSASTVNTNSDSMFSNCPKLCGSAGTAVGTFYDKTYARLDGGITAPGYFSERDVPLAYAVVTKNDNGENVAVTFYYDKNKDEHKAENTTITRTLNASNGYTNWNGSTLTSVTFDSTFGNYSGITSLKNWFANCTTLSSITGLENLNTTNVTDMTGVFDNCPALTSLDLSGFNTANVTTMNSMFRYCSNLETIFVGDGWTTGAVQSATYMFLNSSKIVGNYGTEYSRDHVDISYACIDGPDTPGYLSKHGNPMPYAVVTKDSSNQPLSVAFYFDANIADHNTGNVAIIRALRRPGIYTNWAQSSLTSVTFDESFFGYKGLTSLSQWFSNCKGLTSIDGLQYLCTDNVTNMSSLFYSCEKLTDIDVSHFNTENVTNMENMFYLCSELTELDLTNFDVSKVTATQSMFSGCEKLEVIYATSDWATASNTRSTNMFLYCDKLVGGAMTSYDSNKSDISLAHLDGAPDAPGYFTDKTADIAYAVVTKNDANKPVAVEFFYDKDRASHKADNVTIVRALNKTAVFSRWAGTTLTSVTFDDSFARVSGITTLYRWFEGCTNLTTINGLTNLNTENVTSMENMFYNCSSLTELDISGFDPSKVTSTNQMFRGCTNLDAIYTTADWSAVALIATSNSMFYNCPKLCGSAGTAVGTSYDKTYARLDGGPAAPGYFSVRDVPLAYAVVTKNDDNQPVSVTFYYDKDKDTHQAENTTIVRNLNAFNVYTNWRGATLTDVTFTPSFSDYHGITRLDSWFRSNSALKTINGLTNLNTENVTTMEYMFYDSYNLIELDLTNFDVSNVQKFNSMFGNCRALETIYAKGNWATQTTVESSSMFYDCRKLVGGALTAYNSSNADITFAHVDGAPAAPGYFTDKAQPMPYAVVTKDTDGNPLSVAFYYDQHMAERTGENVAIIRALNSTTAFQNWAGTYQNSSTLTTVTFDSSFAGFTGLTSLANWFYKCSNLTSITGLQNLKTDNVTDMQSMFFECRALTELDISSFNTASVTNMQQMFYYCSALTDLNLSSFNTAAVTNMQYMFYGCRALTQLDLSSFNTEKLTSTYYMFAGCTNLKTIYAKAGTDWNTSTLTSSGYMFQNCSALVGGRGTTYRFNTTADVDANRARIDGGTSAPGYFTDPDAFQVGDVNKDGSITIADVTALVNIILGKTTDYDEQLADVNGDKSVTIADVTALVNIILGKAQ